MHHRPPALLPRRLLLASDLCACCDRPLDRARQLALEWQADLTVVTVREGPETPEEVSSWLDGSDTVHPFELAARAELAEEFAEEFASAGITHSLQVVRGDVTDGILAAAASLSDAVAVIGASRSDSFQHLILGSTASRLAQGLVQPLLVVRRRTRGSYARILVANDGTGRSRQALEATVRLFPGRRITLFHVLEGVAHPAPAPSADALQAALDEGARFLDGCTLPAGAREHIDIVVGHGRVTDAFARQVAEGAVQLVVLGVRRLSAVARVFMGSRNDDLLQHLPCDTLLVRAAESGNDG